MEMQRWADENGKSFNNIFREGAANKVCNMVVNGRISPWIIYLSSSGVAFIEALNEEQVSLTYRFIDPVYWGKKFTDYVADAEYIKEVCLEANL
jgi:hypothetical protein